MDLINKLEALYTSFGIYFSKGMGGAPKHWDQVAMEVPSVGKQNSYPFLGESPRFREWIGERQIQRMKAYSYSLENVSFESSFEVSRDDIDDDLVGAYKPLAESLGYAAATHPDELVFGKLAAAATDLCFDGQPMLSTSHPHDTLGTVSNYTSGAGPYWYLLDTTKPVKPLIFQKRREYEFAMFTDVESESVYRRNSYEFGASARVAAGFGFWQMLYGHGGTLNASNFNTAYSAMQSFTSDRGRPMGITPSLLVVPPSLRDEALSIVSAERDAAGATNINRNAVNVLVSPWLS